MIDRLVQESDPRVHPSTQAFFAHLRPETTAKIADFYGNWHRIVFEMAIGMSAVIKKLDAQLANFGTATFAGKEFRQRFIDGCSECITGVYVSALEGYDEIESILGALRGYEDEGLADALDSLGVDRAASLLHDDTWSRELERV